MPTSAHIDLYAHQAAPIGQYQTLLYVPTQGDWTGLLEPLRAFFADLPPELSQYPEAGTYTMRWDGRDAQGRELASGVYLYRLRTDQGQVETRKLVLLR